MEVGLMVAIGVGVFVLPFVLAWLFHGEDRSDSRGRRLSRRWHH